MYCYNLSHDPPCGLRVMSSVPPRHFHCNQAGPVTILNLFNLNLLSNFYSLAHVNLASLIFVSNSSPRLIFMTMRMASEIAMSTRTILNYLLNFAVFL